MIKEESLHRRRLIKALLLFGNQIRIHDRWPGTTTSWTEPLAFRLMSQLDAIKMKPFYFALFVITSDHFTVGHLQQNISISLSSD